MELLEEKDYRTMTTRFWLEEKRGDRIRIIGQVKGELTSVDINGFEPPSASIDPLLEMPMPFAADFLAAVARFLDEQGIHPESEKLLEGRLMASERHLEDLRKQFDKLLNKILEQ